LKDSPDGYNEQLIDVREELDGILDWAMLIAEHTEHKSIVISVNKRTDASPAPNESNSMFRTP
jgi:hypothetical protein